ncbi:heme o synthase [Thermobifida fusca]|uniref:Protoheme IX farnesyltransferase n=1 Tax=Thermobifida fusca TM51 TaxID=1169414 RepID=A0A9P2TAT3_THEFU|nr:protoheme IX farnesyltransferase [Thermobifida fusca TM51]MBO2530624.1 protoheme IX farnesyltransferase [Thermobifida sp.]PZN62137.1 MAG: protoheme IX farnesyltransferase [Thermobifida fusca]
MSRSASLGTYIRAYIALSKPRVIELLLITTIPVMFVAAQGVPPLGIAVATLVFGTMSAASANAINCYIDRDIDRAMRRTRRRPTAMEQVTPRGTMIYGITLAVLSTVGFVVFVNWLAAALSVFAIAFYIFVYTLLLKRRTAQNVVWGGIAGCMPVLIGWAAITERLDWAPFILFLVVFFWTPPHTWALAMRYREDYAAANVPMLPVVASDRRVMLECVLYSWATVVVSLLLWPIADTTLLYPVAAAVLGVILLAQAHRLYNQVRAGVSGSKLKTMGFFHLSNAYLALLFVAVTIDPLLANALR